MVLGPDKVIGQKGVFCKSLINDGVVKSKICSLYEHFWDSKTAQCRLQITYK